jgi:hypothetical protein
MDGRSDRWRKPLPISDPEVPQCSLTGSSVVGCLDGWTDGLMDGWTVGQMEDGRTDG